MKNFVYAIELLYGQFPCYIIRFEVVKNPKQYLHTQSQ